MNYCFNCGARISNKDQKFCIECGTDLRPREEKHADFKKGYRKKYSPKKGESYIEYLNRIDSPLKDVEAAIYASKFLNLDLEICEVTEDKIREALPDVVKAIGDDKLMKVGVGLTTYFATEMVAHDGLKVAISGQGADELFGGYKRYLKSFVDGTLNYDLRMDMSNMYHVNLERDDACSMLNSVELRLPFLDKALVELVLNIPDNKKIVSMHDDMRKSILRKLAFEEGLDYEIAYRPKKAAQYGTGIDKILRKKILKDTEISQYLLN